MAGREGRRALTHCFAKYTREAAADEGAGRVRIDPPVEPGGGSDAIPASRLTAAAWRLSKR